MRYLILSLILFSIYSCERPVPREILAQNWQYTAAGQPADTFGPSPLYGDVMSVAGDSLIIMSNYDGETISSYGLKHNSDSLTYSLSFSQPDE